MGMFYWLASVLQETIQQQQLQKKLDKWRSRATDYGSQLPDIKPGLVTVMGEVDGASIYSYACHMHVICASILSRIPGQKSQSGVEGNSFLVRSGGATATVVLPGMISTKP